MLTKARSIESFTADATTLVDLAEAEPDAPVPHCGDWHTTDLVAHLCGVWAFLERHARSRATERDGTMNPPDLTGADLFAEARAVADRLAAALADIDPAETVWSWTGDHTGGFYVRRATQETAIHAWDVRAAVGAVEPLAADIARDGIDELADVTYPNLLDRAMAEPTGSLHLHCTDGPGEWTLVVADGRIAVERAHAKGDVAVKGSASDLDLLLWERVAADADDLQIFGDQAVLASWTALTR